MYFLLGVSIKLAFLLFVNMFAAVAAVLVWRLISHRLDWLSPHTRSQLIFALRVGPVIAALIFVFGFVVPAYLLHEPEDSGEVVTLKLAIIAGFASIAILVTTIRVIRTWLVTRRLERAWSDGAESETIEGVDRPVLTMDHPFPVIAVVGIFRPRIFVARQALESLELPELQAAIAHEEGHIRFNDNLKRSILRVARDTLLIPIGADLDRAWSRNVEWAADEFASGKKRSNALDLASAILKLARLAPTKMSSVAAYLLGDDRSEVDDRIRRLVRLADGTVIVGRERFRFVAPAWIWPAFALALTVIHFADQRILLTTHDAIERFVRITQ